MPWKPPLGNAPEIPAPKGVGLFGYLKYIFKVARARTVGWVLVFIGFALVPLILQIMTSLGIGFVSYQLGSFALSEIFSKMQTYVSQLPPEALTFAAMAKIDEAISILFAGLAVRLSFMGFNSIGSSGKQKTMIWKA